MLLYALNLLGTLLGSMTLHLVLPATVRVGEAVPITLRLTNTGQSPATIYLQGRPVAFDIIVSRRDGTPVWRRLEGEVILGILQVRTLAAGETLEFRDTWNQKSTTGEPVGPGQYLVKGVLPSEPPSALETPPTTLRILP